MSGIVVNAHASVKKLRYWRILKRLLIHEEAYY